MALDSPLGMSASLLLLFQALMREIVLGRARSFFFFNPRTKKYSIILRFFF